MLRYGCTVCRAPYTNSASSWSVFCNTSLKDPLGYKWTLQSLWCELHSWNFARLDWRGRFLGCDNALPQVGTICTAEGHASANCHFQRWSGTISLVACLDFEQEGMWPTDIWFGTGGPVAGAFTRWPRGMDEEALVSRWGYKHFEGLLELRWQKFEQP